ILLLLVSCHEVVASHTPSRASILCCIVPLSDRKETSMSDKREDFLIRYAHDFAPFIVAQASGSWIETTEGQRILDFTSGQICSTIGHNHPQLVAAVQRSLEEVIHLNSWM